MPTRTVRRVSNSTALPPSPVRAAHVASQASLLAPGSAVLAPASLRHCAGPMAADTAAQADGSTEVRRERALATVAAWRRADSWQQAAAPVPAWALTPLATPAAPSNDAGHAQRAAHEADEAEERGLSLAMGGLVVGGLVASLLGESAALGCALGLIAGAALGWPLPLSALAEGLTRRA